MLEVQGLLKRKRHGTENLRRGCMCLCFVGLSLAWSWRREVEGGKKIKLKNKYIWPGWGCLVFAWLCHHMKLFQHIYRDFELWHNGASTWKMTESLSLAWVGALVVGVKIQEPLYFHFSQNKWRQLNSRRFWLLLRVDLSLIINKWQFFFFFFFGVLCTILSSIYGPIYATCIYDLLINCIYSMVHVWNYLIE